MHGTRRRTPGFAPAQAASGRAVLLLAVLLLLALVVGLFAALSTSERKAQRAEQRAAVQPEAYQPARPARPGQIQLPPPEDLARAGALGERDEVPAEIVHRFRGKGSIRGAIRVERDGELPSSFRVVAEPSRMLIGREHAERRERSYARGEREFELTGLPLGGYDVRIETPGMNSDPLPVLLFRGAEHPYLNIELRPTGYIDGTVLDAHGAPAEGLAVTLEAVLGGELRSAVTGPSGNYLFEDVPDGEYRLHFGPPHDPLAPSGELLFRAPTLNFPLRRLPALAELAIETYDEAGRPLGGVRVQGYGSPSGQIQLETDARGRATARHLPPGRYRVTARHESGLRARQSVEIRPEEPATLELHLRP